MLNAITTPIRYTLTSGTQVLPVSLFFIENSYLVLRRKRSGVDYLMTSGYTVSGAGVESGGSVTLTGTLTVAGDIVTISREIPLNQLTDYQTNGRFPAAVLERDLDRLAMQVAHQSARIDRTL